MFLGTRCHKNHAPPLPCRSLFIKISCQLECGLYDIKQGLPYNFLEARKFPEGCEHILLYKSSQVVHTCYSRIVLGHHDSRMIVHNKYHIPWILHLDHTDSQPSRHDKLITGPRLFEGPRQCEGQLAEWPTNRTTALCSVFLSLSFDANLLLHNNRFNAIVATC